MNVRVLPIVALLACKADPGDTDVPDTDRPDTDVPPDTDSDPQPRVVIEDVGPFAAGPVRILPLGDSITEYGYRYDLWAALVPTGLDFDFIGSMTSLPEGDGTHDGFPDVDGRPFDVDHEGHAGWTATELLRDPPSWDRGRGQLVEWLDTYTPDVVLLHAGTNDAFGFAPTPQVQGSLRRLVERLQADNPAVAIYLAETIPLAWDDGSGVDYDARIVQQNAYIDEIAEQLSTRTSAVRVVDQYTGFDGNADTYDQIHPNRSGDAKMAARWLEAMTAHTEPVAADDAYAVASDAVLDVSPADGILANDVSWRGALIATLTTPPEHGAILFRTDGSFAYTPDPGFSGRDRFDYSVTDGTEAGGSATVDLCINAFCDAPAIWLPFDGDYTDAGRIGRDGEFVGDDGTFVEGVHGQALHTNGIGHVRLPAPDLRTDRLTITAWVNYGVQFLGSSLVSSHDGRTAMDFGIEDTRSAFGHDWNADPLAARSHSELGVAANEWTFVAMVVDPLSVHIYVGDQVFVDDVEHAPEAFDGELWIGDGAPDVGGGSVAAIDDVRIWDRALSAAEIARVRADEGIPPDPSARAAYVPVARDPRPYRGLGYFSGVCGDLGAVGASWWYNWLPEADCPDPSFVPMIWGRSFTDQASIDAAVASGSAELLGFNEPDYAEQSNIPADVAVQRWQPLSATDLRLGSPATTTHGAPWMTEFVEGAATADEPVDFIAVHWYGDCADVDAAVNDFASYIDRFDSWGQPIWITEFSCYPGDAAQNAAFMAGAIDVIERRRTIERYAWFGDRTLDWGPDFAGASLFDEDGNLSPLGVMYEGLPGYR